MKKFRNIIILLILALVLGSCNVELPVPIVGCYRVAEFEEESFDNYYIQLKDDYTFVLCQVGGATEDKGFVFKGNWRMDMTAYNFKRANGTLELYNVVGPTGFSNLCLTPGVINRFKFTWIKDKDTAKATLCLESTNRFLSDDIATGFLISEEKFNESIVKVMGGSAK